MTLYEFDKAQGVQLLCGIDEAGRGPLAGDVYAAAVILPDDFEIDGINDSKKLSPKKRDLLYDIIVENAVAWSIGVATVQEIDNINILNATMLAMQRAADGLRVKPKLILVDGNKNPRLSVHSRTVVKGDATSACIAAASIIAKVARDRYMEQLAVEYPQYQFDKHKGYGTALHYEMLDKYGISEVHRQSFLKKYKSGIPTKRQQNGEIGESAASVHLENMGFTVIDRNYHSKYGEIDIIAKNKEYLAFVEVKARNENTLAPPREAVGKSKQAKLVKTAHCYMDEEKTGVALQPRFDVAEVYIKDGRVTSLEYIENAFGVDG